MRPTLPPFYACEKGADARLLQLCRFAVLACVMTGCALERNGTAKEAGPIKMVPSDATENGVTDTMPSVEADASPASPEPDKPDDMEGAGPSEASNDAGTAGPLTLSSPVVQDGGEFASDQTCDGEDRSPALMFTKGPAGTQSYALFLTDLDAMLPGNAALVHWVLWDIPQTVVSVPEQIADGPMPSNVPGAKQVRALGFGEYDYFGPCPPRRGNTHNYEITLVALGVATLSNASMTAQPAQIVQLIEGSGAVLARAVLHARYKKK